MKKYSSLLLLVFLLGCTTSDLYQKTVDFPNNSWQKFNILKFEYNNKEKGIPCNINLKLYINDELQGNFIPITFTITSPSSDERTQVHRFWVRNQEGELIGKKQNDTYEFTFPLRENYLLSETGNYEITLQTNMYKYDNFGFKKLELIIEKSK